MDKERDEEPVVPRIVRWALEEAPATFRSGDALKLIKGPSPPRQQVSAVLSTLDSLRLLERTARGHWKRVSSDAAWWRERVVNTFEAVGAGNAVIGLDERERERTLAMRYAADCTLELLTRLRGKTLLLDSGRQVARVAESLADALNPADPERRARHRGAVIWTSNCPAFLELVPFRAAGDVAGLLMIGGEYIPGMRATIPDDPDHPDDVHHTWEVVAAGAPPIVLMSVSSLTQQGLWTHFPEQAAWKLRMLESAPSLYLVVDASKLEMGRDIGHLLIGPQQRAERWSEFWAKRDLHVVVGRDPRLGWSEAQRRTKEWLEETLGERLVMAEGGAGLCTPTTGNRRS